MTKHFQQVTTGKWTGYEVKFSSPPPPSTQTRILPAPKPTPAPAPAPTTPAPQPVTTEADRLRAWINTITPAAEPVAAEFYNYRVSVCLVNERHYLSTLSPQQKAVGRRTLGTLWARGSWADLLQGLERFIKEREQAQERHASQKQARKQARESFVNPYKPGDILYSSWGYDQTNREFYQILEVRDVAIKVCEVFQNRERDGYDSGHCSPRRDEFKGAPKWITIQVDERGNHSVPSPIHGNLYVYEGKPVYFSDGH